MLDKHKFNLATQITLSVSAKASLKLLILTAAAKECLIHSL
jgi:hypothetical protein